MAATIPDEVKSNIPIKSPITPKLFTVSIAPCISKCPKDVIGTSAPPPAQSTNLSYILKDFMNNDIPVVGVKESNIIKPFDKETVKIDIDYYDKDSSEEEQQKSF